MISNFPEVMYAKSHVWVIEVLKTLLHSSSPSIQNLAENIIMESIVQLFVPPASDYSPTASTNSSLNKKKEKIPKELAIKLQQELNSSLLQQINEISMSTALPGEKSKPKRTAINFGKLGNNSLLLSLLLLLPINSRVFDQSMGILRVFPGQVHSFQQSYQSNAPNC